MLTLSKKAIYAHEEMHRKLIVLITKAIEAVQTNKTCCYPYAGIQTVFLCQIRAMNVEAAIKAKMIEITSEANNKLDTNTKTEPFMESWTREDGWVKTWLNGYNEKYVNSIGNSLIKTYTNKDYSDCDWDCSDSLLTIGQGLFLF